MKKLIVLGIVSMMVMGLAVAGYATIPADQFVKDTDWSVSLSLNNGNWTTGPPPGYGSAGQDIKLGNAATASTANGLSYATSTIAVVRDMSASGAGYGLSTNLKTALDQTGVQQEQVWTDIELWANGGYTAPNLYLKVWATGIDPKGPSLKLVCTQAVAGCGFAVGDTIFNFDNFGVVAGATDGSLANSAKQTAGISINLTNYKSVYVGKSAATPAATFSLIATTPALAPVNTPEPGSMLALFSGFVGLVGFGIRRRK